MSPPWPRVHAHRAADTPWDADRPGHTRATDRGESSGRDGQEHGTSEDDRTVARGLDLGESGAELDEQPVEASIGDQHVRSRAEDEDRHLRRTNERSDRRDILDPLEHDAPASAPPPTR